MADYKVVSEEEAKKLRRKARNENDRQKYTRVLVSREAHTKLKEMAASPEYEDCGNSILGVVDALVLGRRKKPIMGAPKGQKWRWAVEGKLPKGRPKRSNKI